MMVVTIRWAVLAYALPLVTVDCSQTTMSGKDHAPSRPIARITRSPRKAACHNRSLPGGNHQEDDEHQGNEGRTTPEPVHRPPMGKL